MLNALTGHIGALPKWKCPIGSNCRGRVRKKPSKQWGRQGLQFLCLCSAKPELAEFVQGRRWAVSSGCFCLPRELTSTPLTEEREGPTEVTEIRENGKSVLTVLLFPAWHDVSYPSILSQPLSFPSKAFHRMTPGLHYRQLRPHVFC